MYNIMSSANSDISTFSLPVWMSFIYLFIYSFIHFCLIVVARTSNTVPNSGGENRYPCLVPESNGFHLFTIKNDITWGFVLNDLSCVDMFSYYTSFAEGFLYHE